MCFICACMDVPTQLELCLYDQLNIAGLLLVSLLFIAIPTPFLNFYLFLVCLLFNVQYVGPHLSSLRLKTYRLCNLVMHVPCPLLQLKHFILYCGIALKKLLTLTRIMNRGLRSISLVLVCFLERLCRGAK